MIQFCVDNQWTGATNVSDRVATPEELGCSPHILSSEEVSWQGDDEGVPKWCEIPILVTDPDRVGSLGIQLVSFIARFSESNGVRHGFC
jgi:hypothetical protein